MAATQWHQPSMNSTVTVVSSHTIAYGHTRTHTRTHTHTHLQLPHNLIKPTFNNAVTVVSSHTMAYNHTRTHTHTHTHTRTHSCRTISSTHHARTQHLLSVFQGREKKEHTITRSHAHIHTAAAQFHQSAIQQHCRCCKFSGRDFSKVSSLLNSR